jgi:hypothetical protein
MAKTKTVVNDTKPIDDAVDDAFGEPVVLKPMKTMSSGYREALPDDSRQPIITRGIFDQARGIIENTAGSQSGFMHKQATVGVSLSIRQEPVIQCDLRKGDRVFFPERDETYEVSYIHDDPGGRPDVNLLKVIEE